MDADNRLARLRAMVERYPDKPTVKRCVMRAAPELIAVVEAARATRDAPHNLDVVMLAAALAALDAKLAEVLP